MQGTVSADKNRIDWSNGSVWIRASQGAANRFPSPQINGLPVDQCLNFGSGCGQPAADAFCRTQRFAGAASFAVSMTSRTHIIGDNRPCDASSGCGALRNVVCVAGAAPPAPSDWSSLAGDWTGHFASAPTVFYPQRIVAANGQLTFYGARQPNNPNDMLASRVTIDGAGNITAPEYGVGGRVSADRNRIDWANGAVWLRGRLAPPPPQADWTSLAGNWSGAFNGQPNVVYPGRISVSNGQLVLHAARQPNNATDTADSPISIDAAGNITASAFQLTGRVSPDRNRIDWNNNSAWVRGGASAQPAPLSSTNLALGKPTTTSSRSIFSTPSENGGVDGIKNGGFGFHTNEERNPWWTVDLQQTATLGEIRVFNRADGNGDRSRTLRALVSVDGANWQQVYDQGGQKFGADGVPLRISLNNIQARWVRLQLNDTTYLHLDEVEVYGSGGSAGAAPGPAADPAPGPAVLGRVWREQESGFAGIWTRRQNSNVYDASWPAAGVTAVLTMSVSGNQVAIDRRGGETCRYAGTITGQTVSGLFDGCTGGALNRPWSAVIDGAAASPVRPPDAIFIPPTAAANADTTTQGNWRGRYGRDGAILAADSESIPFRSATVTPTGKADFAWAAETTDGRGLQHVGRSGRIAGTWYADQSFEVEIALASPQPARLSAYFLDWDSLDRAQRVELVDATTNAVLDTRAVSKFVNGQYLSWRIATRVKLRITRTAGRNAVLSGLFLDYDGSAPSANSASAAFLGGDTGTLGNWIGRYGGAGALITGDGATPSSFTFTPKWKYDYVWGATAEARAPQLRSQNGRVAAAWYAEGAFDVEIQPPSSQTYRLSAYFLDWDGTGRGQRVELVDTAARTVLDTQSISGFRNGQYLSWRVSGPVTLRLSRMAGPNVTLAGLFVDADGAAPPPVPPGPSDLRPPPPGPPAPQATGCANPRTLFLMDQWLARARPIPRPGDDLRYEPWGRLVGRTATATIQTPAPPDTRLSRCEWLWQYSPQMNSTNLGTLRDFVVQSLR